MKNKVEQGLPGVMLITRIALICSVILIFAADILILLFGTNSGTYDVVLWYAIMFAMWTLFCAIPLLLIIALYKKLTKKEVWGSIKRETILLLINIAGVIILFLIVKGRG